MAYDKQKLMRASSHFANGDSGSTTGDVATEWSYASTADAQADANTAGYMNDSADVLKVNDRIWATLSDGTFQFIVVSNDGTIVDLSDGVELDATDSD